MKSTWISALAALLVGSGLATGQVVVPSPTEVPQSQEKDTPLPVPSDFDSKTPLPGPGDKVPESPGSPKEKVWGSAEYLFWGIKDSRTPPLVTVSPPASGGILNRPGTITVFGGSNVENEERPGGRFTVGAWLNDCQTLGVEGSYLFLGNRSNHFGIGSPGTPGTQAIARPFFNAGTNMEDAELVAFPGTLAGRVDVNYSSQLRGAEINGVYKVCCCCSYRVDLLAGLRFLQLNEDLGISENLMVAPNVASIGGTHFGVFDQFNTRNEFYGGQVGVRAEFRRGNCFVNVLGKVAVGDTHETISIDGNTVITPRGGLPTVAKGGLLALPSNIGQYNHDDFAVVPEVGFNIGYQVNHHLRVYAGYTFLYWSDVGRPGDQIDRTLNTSQIPITGGFTSTPVPARPAFNFKDTDFWAQGINVGLEFRF